ncbi:hypothetical protein AAC387_Pa08g2656 [Persea americana]
MQQQSRRYLSSFSSAAGAVKQVTKANFSPALGELKDRITNSDFIAVSSQKTGASSAPWTRILPIDTSETAYLKAKAAAERFEVLQFAVCPFKIQGSKIIASPYNFHLFPRDELNIGMPSYGFSCQTSCLTSMAREGFDFNVCIYDGISYLSRVQESAAKGLVGNPIPGICQVTSASSPSVADTIFIERIKSRVRHWRDACHNSNKTTDDALVKSLRKLILGGEIYGSRPCMNIDVCNDSQVQLVVQMLSKFSDDLVPLIIPDMGGGPKSVRIVLTSSEEDKILLKNELQNLEEEQCKQVRGFRSVIDFISSSQKPLVGYNCLSDFTFIHSKFLAPLPPNMTEFMCSLRTVFSNVLDLNHLLKEIGPLKRANSLPAAVSYLKRHFFVPFEMEVLNEEVGQYARTVQDYANIFYPCSSNSLHDPVDENASGEMETLRKVRTESLIFLWGFRRGISAGVLKSSLRGVHDVFSEDFHVRLVDKSCAVVVFWRPGLADALLEDMASGAANGSASLREMISEGLEVAGYGTYMRVCRLGLWEENLADSLDKALCELSSDLLMNNAMDTLEINGGSDLMINLDDL